MAGPARDAADTDRCVSEVPEISLLAPEHQGWHTFALEHATSPLQHPTWLDTLAGAYGLHAKIIVLVDSQGSILAGLPVVRSKLPWRRRWSSLPFTDTLEPVAVDRARRDQLLIAAASAADADPIVVRTEATLPGWFSRQVGTVQVVDVSNGAAGVLGDATAGTRLEVSRARRPEGGLTARLITSRHEFLGASLSLIAQSRRRLGAPTQPRRYWSRVWELHEQDQALTVGVYLGEQLVANGVFILGSDHAVYKYSASDASARHLRTNYLMLATAFDEVAQRGAQSMDFGVTDLGNESLRKFKTRWGGEERPAHYSATDASLLPQTLEPGRLVSRTIQQAPTLVGRTIGSLAYPFVA